MQLDGGSSASFLYDGLGRRTVRTEGSDTTHFYYNEEWQVLTETNGAGAATATYLYHPHYIDAVAERMTSAAHPIGVESEHFYTHDALFNVTSAIVNSTIDAVVERYAYTPYGEARFLDNSYNDIGASAIKNEKLFTGRRVDPGTGLQINRHRYYHQQLGRWSQRDPIGYAGGDANLYGYVGSGPSDWVDPSGECDFRLDLNDHGGPHFQRGDSRWDARTLEPLEHRGRLPSPLTKKDLEDIRQSDLWDRLLKNVPDTNIEEVARKLLTEEALEEAKRRGLRNLNKRIAKEIIQEVLKKTPLAVFFLTAAANEAYSDAQRRGVPFAITNQMFPVELVEDLAGQMPNPWEQAVQSGRDRRAAFDPNDPMSAHPLYCPK